MNKYCIVRECDFEEMVKSCYLWFLQQHGRGAPISSPQIQEKEIQLFPKICADNEASEFMTRFWPGLHKTQNEGVNSLR